MSQKYETCVVRAIQITRGTDPNDMLSLGFWYRTFLGKKIAEILGYPFIQSTVIFVAEIDSNEIKRSKNVGSSEDRGTALNSLYEALLSNGWIPQGELKHHSTLADLETGKPNKVMFFTRSVLE